MIYSAKKTSFGLNAVFELERTGSGKFLQSKSDPNAVFRFVKKEEFMLNSVFADGFEKIYDEDDEDSFYLKDYQYRKPNMINVIGNRSRWHENLCYKRP